MARIRNFADHGEFAIWIGQIGETTSIILWRTDVKLLGGNAPEPAVKGLYFSIGLYKTCEYPVPGFSYGHVARTLRGFLRDMPGLVSVTIE